MRSASDPSCKASASLLLDCRGRSRQPGRSRGSRPRETVDVERDSLNAPFSKCRLAWISTDRSFEHFPHRRRAERPVALLERLTNLVHGVVPLAEGADRVARGCLLGRGPGAAVGRDKEDRAPLAPKHAEGPRRRPEGASDLVRRARLHEVGALFRYLGPYERAPALR